MKKLLYAILCGVMMIPGMVSAQSDVTQLSLKAKVPSDFEKVTCFKAIVSSEIIGRKDSENEVNVQLLLSRSTVIHEGVSTCSVFLGRDGVKSIGAGGQRRPFPVNAGAIWAVVVDDSDPTGRDKVVPNEIFTAGLLTWVFDPNSRVGVYSLARDLEFRASSESWNRDGSENGPFIVPNKDEKAFITKFMADCFPEWQLDRKGRYVFYKKDATSKMNTHLWAGLSTLISQRLVKQRNKQFTHLPINIILISDGRDEGGNLNELIKLAQAENVRIHTVAYPFKSRTDKKHSDTERQRGYNDLMALSEATGGRYCAVSGSTFQLEHPENDIPPIIEENEAYVLEFSFDKDTFLEAFEGDLMPDELNVRLESGNGDVKGLVTIPVEEMSRFYATNRLGFLQEVISGISAELKRNSQGSVDIDEKGKASITKFGKTIVKVLSITCIRDSLENLELRGDFKTMMIELLRFFDHHPGAMRTEEGAFMAGKFSLGLVGLDELRSSVSNSSSSSDNNTTVNNPVINLGPGSLGGDVEDTERATVEDWIWWIIGIGLAVMCILVFYCIYRIINKPQSTRPRILIPPAGRPEPVALASLVNTANTAQQWTITKTDCSVGRRSGNDISLPFTYVSGTQFYLTQQADGQWELRDANSTNGTIVNGNRVKTARLRNGDKIRIGGLELEFVRR